MGPASLSLAARSWSFPSGGERRDFPSGFRDVRKRVFQNWTAPLPSPLLKPPAPGPLLQPLLQPPCSSPLLQPPAPTPPPLNPSPPPSSGPGDGYLSAVLRGVCERVSGFTGPRCSPPPPPRPSQTDSVTTSRSDVTSQASVSHALRSCKSRAVCTRKGPRVETRNLARTDDGSLRTCGSSFVPSSQCACAKHVNAQSLP